MSIEGSYNFRRISATVTTSGVVGAERLGDLRTQGYDAVINLLPDSSEHAVAGEAGIVRDQGVSYVYIPVDFAAPTPADFAAFAQAMDDHDGQTIHVHCAANFRVSAFYGLYAARKGRWTSDQAHELIAGLWHLQEHPAWAAFVAAELPPV